MHLKRTSHKMYSLTDLMGLHQMECKALAEQNILFHLTLLT